MKRTSHNVKLTPEQREELLRVYYTDGRDAARVLALSLGVYRDYARAEANRRGYRPKYKPAGTLLTRVHA